MRWGKDLLQTGDRRPVVAGALTGVTAAITLWRSSIRGTDLDGQKVILATLGLFVVGIALLLLRKEGLSSRRSLALETLGAGFAAPLIIGFAVFGLFLWLPDPDAFRKPQS